jgi:protein-S-isoprenylcysteine O-methyltransferase Ste14
MPDRTPPTIRHTASLIAKTCIHTLLLPGAVLVGVPWVLVEHAPELHSFPTSPLLIWPLAASAALFLAGAVKLCWDFIAVGDGTPNPLDPPKHLVLTSSYRFVRNPGYLAVFAILASEAAYFGSANLMIYTCIAIVGFHQFVVKVEEPGLRVRFGDDYRRFCSAVPRWIPRLTPWEAS